ncbi:MAG: type IV pilus secretin PilQ [Bacteriovoracaceae bacterium]|nr:type IV pilus secretin PilQ [Bacteriovoracaceae bacterium]
MKKGIFRSLILMAFVTSFSSESAELLSMNFQQVGEVSQLELVFDDNNVVANKFHVNEDKQIIIDLKGVGASQRTLRGFDTSEFSGSVVFVSAYKKPGSGQDLRVALQLRDNVRSVIKRKPERLVLEIENRFGVFTQQKVSQFNSFNEKINVDEGAVGSVKVPKSESLEDILDNLTMSGRKKYVGKKISFNVKNISVEDILNLIAESSGFNIIITEEIKKLPPLTLNLNNVPWDQALDTILGLNKLVATKNGVILMVTTLEKATEDQKLEAAAKKVVQKEEPLVTKVFPISFTKTTDLRKILTEYSTDGRGKISQDERTNSLIVKDVPGVIEKMRKIVEVLDTQTPQVMIEAKIVEVSESYSKEIGLKEGLTFGYDPIGSNNGAAGEVGADLTAGVVGGPGFSFSTAPNTTGRNIFGLAVKRFGRLTDLSFNLQLMESESKGKIIASPKVVTENKKKAKIETSDKRFFVVSATEGDTTTTEIKEVEATLTLEVTPQVTNEGSISLEINLNKEQFAAQTDPSLPPPEQGRKVETNVLVDNGSTIVLGGIYNFEKRENHSGIPWLKDIPLIGWLFRTPHNPATEKNELVIFITPRIVNQEEAGLLDKG